MEDSMRIRVLLIIFVCLVLGTLTPLSVVNAQSPDEDFRIYENWKSSKIRADRWSLGRNSDSLEVMRGVSLNHLFMKYRAQGPMTTNSGQVLDANRLFIKNASKVTKIEADFRVLNLKVVGCPANSGVTRVSPAMLDLSAFNDNASSVGTDMTGDHFIRVAVTRESDSTDPPGVLTGQAFLYRCLDSTCSNANSTIFNTNIGKVKVWELFALRAIWDPANNRFLVGMNEDEFFLNYGDLNKGPARNPFSTVRMQMTLGSCVESPTEGDMETMVGIVRTNASAIIP
jgi:hypothetical protein